MVREDSLEKGRIGYPLQDSWSSLVAHTVKSQPETWETWVGKIPWRRAWRPTPVFLPGESPGTEEPGGLQFMGPKESDRTEQLSYTRPYIEQITNRDLLYTTGNSTQYSVMTCMGKEFLNRWIYISVQLLSCVRLFETSRTAARQASLSIINSRSLLKLMTIVLVMPSNHVILCHPLLLPSIFPSIRVFSNESVLHIRWPKYWSFSFSISPSCKTDALCSTPETVTTL